MKTSCKFYSFLRAVRGNWRNAIFVSCGCDACMYGREKPCSGFLLTVDERGQVMLLATETIRELTGEEVEPAECSAVLSRRSFDAAFSKYVEWHAPETSPSASPAFSMSDCTRFIMSSGCSTANCMSCSKLLGN